MLALPSPSDKTYKFVIGDEEIFIDARILRRFRTLQAMIDDLGEVGPEIAIPLDSVGVTPKLMRFMVRFYEIYEDQGMKGVRSAIRGDMKEGYADEAFYHDWVFLINDEYEIAELAKSADFLDASELVIFIIDQIYNELFALSPKQLKRRFESITKRKFQLDATTTDKRPIREQYKRAVQIQAILSALLPYTLVRGIGGIQKHPPYLMGNEFLTFIRDQDGSKPPLLFRHYEAHNLADPVSDFALSKKNDHQLHNDRIREVSCGQIFYTTLDDVGKLQANGEMTKVVGTRTFSPWTAYNFDYGQVQAKGIELPESLLLDGDTQCLAVWSGFNTIIMLTTDKLYSYASRSATVTFTRLSEIENIEPASVLDVACGSNHVFLLTRNGLYGYGINNTLALGVSADAVDLTIPSLIDVNGEIITKIWTGVSHSLALSKSGILYACGDNTHYQLPIKEVTGVKNYKWTMASLPANLPMIDIITGSAKRTVIVAGNKIYQAGTTGMTHYCGHVYPIPFDKGIIRDVVCKDNYILVATNQGIYFITMTSTDRNDFLPHLEQLGGSDSTSSPYELRIKVTSTDEEEEQAREDESETKKRRISCQSCSAFASYVNATKSAFFCSGYCAHKESLNSNNVI